jgi:hypothetical protein
MISDALSAHDRSEIGLKGFLFVFCGSRIFLGFVSVLDFIELLS